MAKELSVFIDESGDFGEYSPRSPFYIIGVVFHDQDDDISDACNKFKNSLIETTSRDMVIHFGPLIRRENEYHDMSPAERKKILRRMLAFISKIDFTYKTFVVDKHHVDSENELIYKLAKQFSEYVRAHYPYFFNFNKIKVYYDHGQEGVMRIIMTVFAALANEVEFKNALPKDYRLLQVADLVCTAKLLELKMKRKVISNSERTILGSDRDIKQYLLKPLKKKEFKK